MELRSALFVIGLVVVVIIAIITYRKAHSKPFSLKDRSGKDDFLLEPHTGEVDPLFAPGASASRADIELTMNPDADPEEDLVSIPLNEDVDEALTEGITEPPLVADQYERDVVIAPEAEAPLQTPVETVNEPVAKPVAAEQGSTRDLEPQSQPPKRDHRPEKSIDYVALIRGSQPIRRDQALGVYRQHEFQMEKASYLYGFNIVSGLWCDLENEQASGEYRDICLAIQMADAEGSISDSELHRFSQMSLAVAEELERPIIFSLDHDEALAYARDLDRFCADTDLLVIFNLIARSERGFSMRAVHREVGKLGLAYSADNIYQKVHVDADGHTEILYSLANMYKPGTLTKDPDASNTSGLSLFMQVTTTNNPAGVYSDMIEDIALLAKRLNAVLVDQERRPLNEVGLSKIHRKIVDIARRMESRGIQPGGQIAHRLY
jgi:FtsZ-interacting cell division protein ZipA